jgi:hypothetical protein
VLGFHFSHCIGVLMFALLILLASVYGIVWLQPLLIAIGCSYVAVSYFCWFPIPTIGIGIATVLLTLE